MAACTSGAEPTSAFGEVFQYNNMMAAAAGYIGGHLVYADLELGAAYDRAMQTLGGMGYASEYHVERYFRESRILRLAPVSQEMVLNYLAQHVLELPRSY